MKMRAVLRIKINFFGSIIEMLIACMQLGPTLTYKLQEEKN